MKTIVVLGAGLGAIPLIRQVMRKQVLPGKDLKLVVVAPNTHMHWTIATPRLIVPGQYQDDQVLVDLGPRFAQYPQDKFERLLGKATALSPESRTVTVGLNDGGERTVSYDVLVIATGSTAVDGMPWKDLGGTEKTKAQLHKIQRQIREAKTIVVAGGGMTGTETAGELGFEYSRNGTKEVYFVYSEAMPLAATSLDSVRKACETELKNLKVKLVASTTIGKTTVSSDTTTLELRHEDGSTKTLTAHAYIPATGLAPNSSFAPASMLDARDQIKQTTTLRALGYEDIFVVGDVGSLETPTATNTETQMLHAVKALAALVAGEPVLEYKPNTKEVYGVTLGRSRATGQMGSWKLLSLMVWWFKGRTLGTDVTPDIAAGKRGMVSKFE